ncbi:MAG: hypothetical protein QXK76_02945 [Candidatus Woesearchaeota archaeon]
MDINNVVKEIESSEVFRSIDPEHYLVHIFRMMDANSVEECQVGYYNVKSDKIVVFDYIKGKITINSPQDAFKEKNYIEPLDLSKVKVSMDDALVLVNEVVKNNYPSQAMSKAILLLQKLPEYGQIWNVTIVTNSFNVINIKINAETSEILHHGMESLLRWQSM